MKRLTEYIAEAKKSREEFIEELRAALDKTVKEKSLDAWFFNWADIDQKEARNAEKLLDKQLPGKWKFVEITGNGTNVGCGWFKDKEYGVTISLSCDNEGETDNDYIDGYDIEE